jgi:lysophospholipase L1-like esterase
MTHRSVLPHCHRRRFLALSATAVAAVQSILPAEAGEARAGRKPNQPEPGALAWHDVQGWGVEGRGWSHTERFFDRLPAKAKGKVRDAVWGLSHHSAGMCARFETDATALRARYTLASSNLAMPHMPATGVSGLDLYAQDSAGRWRWLAAARPDHGPKLDVGLIDGIEPGQRAYMLYLPLYNGVESLAIGVPARALFKPLPPRTERPIVFYGTSITHGGCASRPGMAYPAILGRRLDRPTVNLGFSGNGTMDLEVGALLAELDAAVYVIDCVPNMTAPMVAQRTEPLVRQLRAARIEVPIVLVEDRTYANAPLVPGHRQRHASSRAALRAAYDRLQAAGVQRLFYVEGEGLLGTDGEATVDASHPTDLGMLRMADALEPVLRPLLKPTH